MCEIGVAEDLSERGRLATGQIDARAFRVGLEAGCGVFPVALDNLRHRVPVGCVIDGRLKEIGPGKLAEAAVQLGPAIDCAGDGDRVDAFLRHGIDPLGAEMIDGEQLWAPSRWR